MMNYKALGARIRLLRKSRQMTQAELAEQADLSISFLGHIERGTRKASLDTLVTLCNVLEVTPTFLLQDSLSSAALNEHMVTRKDIVQEISENLIKNLRQWSENA